MSFHLNGKRSTHGKMQRNTEKRSPNRHTVESIIFLCPLWYFVFQTIFFFSLCGLLTKMFTSNYRDARERIDPKTCCSTSTRLFCTLLVIVCVVTVLIIVFHLTPLFLPRFSFVSSMNPKRKNCNDKNNDHNESHSGK